MVEGATAPAVDQVVGTTTRTPVEREILKVEKKLREVEKLRQRRDGGETLDVLQSSKIDKEDELRKSHEDLKEQREKEIAEAARREEEAKSLPAKADAQDSTSKVDVDNVVDAQGVKQTRKKFDSRCFEGDWLDTLGQRIIVTRGYRRRGRTGTMVTYTYKALVLRNGIDSKNLTILYDPEAQEWRCGNGSLDRENSEWDKIAWDTVSTGRSTEWTRTPPDGAIFFDMPSGFYDYDQQYQQDGSAGLMMHDGVTYFDEAPGGYPSMQGQDAYSGQEEWPASLQTGQVCLVPVDADSSGQGQVYPQGEWSTRDAQLWEAFGDKDASAAAASGSTAKTTDEVKKVADDLVISSEASSDDFNISSNRLDWTVPNSWGELRKLPTQSHIASPVFDVQGSPGMHLEFYPNGMKSTEAGCCCLQLTRGPESKVGVKFELCVNGRSNGPKACLGRRFLADYPMPFDGSDGDEAKEVIVSFLILGTF